MKFLEKVKNMFTEEVEEVKPVKPEVRKVEIVPPTKPTNQEEIVNPEKRQENEPVKVEEKPKAPVFFDDKDFDKLPTASNVEKPKEVTPQKVLPKIPKEKKEVYGGKNPAFSATVVKEEKRTFKPTPIISPVYGVLDKNYKRDDIVPKKRIIETKKSKELTIDDIRNKAFGTLEDDLETTLFGKEPIVTDDLLGNDVDDIGLDLFDELEEKEPIKEPVMTRAEKNKELELLNEVDDLENIVINERPEAELTTEKEEVSEKQENKNDNMIEDEMDKICNEPNQELEEETDLTESDLFNLIDSMYEKKEGEE